LSSSNETALVDEVMLIVNERLTEWKTPVKDVSLLAEKFFDWTAKTSSTATPPIEPLVDRLLNHCNCLEDLRHVSQFVQSADRSETQHGKVEQKFHDDSVMWVNEEIDNSELAEHADDVINDYESTASVLGVAEEPLTEERARISGMYDDSNDDEDTDDSIVELETEKSEADDILDSLRY
jgi:hypothetical protein